MVSAVLTCDIVSYSVSNTSEALWYLGLSQEYCRTVSRYAGEFFSACVCTCMGSVRNALVRSGGQLVSVSNHVDLRLLLSS